MLICGILSSLFYAGTDILGGMLWQGHSFTSQAVSDLSAIGAPSRPFIFPLFIIYDVLFIAFALGVWGLAGQKRALRFIGGMLFGLGVINFVAIFIPEHLHEAAATFANTMHIISRGCDFAPHSAADRFWSLRIRKVVPPLLGRDILTLLVVGALVGLGSAQIIAQ